MAAKKRATKSTQRVSSDAPYGSPKFPYTVTPNSLRRFLDMVPNKPKPQKVVASTLKAWGFKNTNDQTILRVLKQVELLDSAGVPTEKYTEFMQPHKGPAALGRQIRKIYDTLFQHVTNPANASHEELKNFFNTYGGGSERAVQLQIQTFKALAEHATFGVTDPLEQPEHPPGERVEDVTLHGAGGLPTVRIDLHIHLPENKTKLDYDAILESIATHIYGRRS